MSARNALMRRWPAFVVFAIAVIGAIVGGVVLHDFNNRMAQASLVRIAERANWLLEARLKTFEYGLRGARGAIIGASGEMSRDRFARYMSSRDLAVEFPGALGFGFIRRVAASDEASFLTEAKRDGQPDLSIHALGPQVGERFVIQYIEPLAENASALGLDIASEPRRRAAAIAAMETGRATLTKPIELVQESRGFLMLLPVQRRLLAGNDALPDRDVTAGWVYAPISILRLFDKFDDHEGQLAFDVVDVTGPEPQVPVFTAGGPAIRSIQTTTRTEIYGRTWQITMHATPRFVEQLHQLSPTVLGLAIVLLFGLLATIMLLVQWSYRRHVLLSTERDQLTALVHSSQDAIVATNLAGVITSWNTGAGDLLGYPASEAIGRRLADLCVDASAWQCGDEPVDTQLRHRDGTAIDVSFRISPIRRADGVEIARSVIARDMRGQKRSERALLASEQRFRDLAEAIPHLVWTCEPDGRCDYLSPQWVSYTGYPEVEQLGFGWTSRLHPDDVDRVNAAWATATARGDLFDIQFRIRRADGEYRWFHTRASPIRSADGQLLKWYGTNTDVQAERDAATAMARLNDELEARVRASTDDLRRANAELAASADQLETAQRIARLGSFEATIDGTQVWSDELYRILGLEPEASAQKLAASMFTTASWAQAVAARDRALALGESYELSLDLLRADGEPRVVIARGAAVRDASGAIAKLVGTLQDVTDTLRAQRELAVLSERLHVATHAARLGVWDWDVGTNALVWDEQMYDIYGVAPAEFANEYAAWSARVHPDDRVATEQHLADALAGTRDYDPVFRIVWANGDVRYVAAAAKVERSSTGQPLRVVGVNHDVTERYVAERALRTAEALQRAILANAGLAIIATDCTGTITLFNRAAEDLLGYTAAEVIGIHSPGVFHDRDEVLARWPIVERELGITIDAPFEVFALPTHVGPETREWSYICKDGRRVPVLLSTSALRDEAGTISGYLGLAVDLSLRKQQERELLELNRLLSERSAQAESASHAKSMFLANMSHEIRTPMNAITGVGYLLRQTDLSRDQQSLVQTLQSATRTLLNMINDVLDLSKIEAHQLVLDHSPFSLSNVLDDLMSVMTTLSAEKRLELELELDDRVPDSLVGDPVRLGQILTNLVGNAIKFTEAGRVRLRITREDGQAGDRVPLRFEVHDSGPGIEATLIPRLFTPFTQSETSARRSGGTGLGLAIVRQLANLMGGAVGVRSALGVGSEFWCAVPFEVSTTGDVGLRGRPLDVLVADPDRAQNHTLASYARRFGWYVEQATTADEAVVEISARTRASRPFDAILVACDGNDALATATLEAVRAAHDPRTAVVITTRDPVWIEKHARRGESILAYPITRSSLYETIVEVMSSRDATTLPRINRVGQERAARLADLRILVADDSPLNQVVAQRILEHAGAQVEVAADGLAAVKLITDAPRGFDAVLMDIQMPNLDGIEATSQIRAIPDCATLPILAVTAGALVGERSQAMDAGVDMVISKPFDPSTVLRGIRRLVDKRRGRATATPSGGTGPLEVIRDVPDAHGIDGIDLADVRARLGDDPGLISSLLGHLVRELDTIATLPRDSSREVVAAGLHRLRGIAGNMGARALSTLAAGVESTVRADEVAPDVALGSISEEVARLRASAITAMNARTAAARPAGSGSGDAAGSEPERPPLKTLLHSLREQHLHAPEMFARLSGSLEVLMGGAKLEHFRRLVDTLDYAAAADLLSAYVDSAA